MDVLGVTDQKTVKAGKKTCKRSASRSKKGVKVVYISSPMKVKTSATQFRMIVQELTGRDSDVASIMEGAGASGSEVRWNRIGDAFHLNTAEEDKQCQLKGTACGDIFYDCYPRENKSPAADFESWVELEGFLDENSMLLSMPAAEAMERGLRDGSFPIVFQESALLDVHV
ncbi:hypothetical protein SAY86_001582 [Trapa natans]|uniref:VQ domain-containing protein n=1 Tax=Trapa natans TaxID=22666 RepID=A0AAN7MD03_TRANT|nr:hypothetical protein SAY86_001582 [Trapa natans]